jgi:Lipoprotein LpqB beta-propeller domain/Sporulation and spore germination
MVKGRRLLTAAATLMSAAAVAGCVSMPSSGPVLAYQPTDGAGVSQQQYLQLNSEPPGAGWGPKQIVEGFLAANASFAGDHKVAREYLTHQFSAAWGQDWSADVFKDVPIVTVSPGPQSRQTATVTVTGSRQASVTARGTYAVPSSTNTTSGTKNVTTITLTKTGAGWRISRMFPTSDLLLSATDFQANYQQRDLYFFDPHLNHLVADPVYVPVAAVRAADPEDLLRGLVRDLINQPADWLNTATKTTFPHGTKLIGDVSLSGGIANVALEGAEIGRANSATDERIAAQLLWTLAGSADSQPAVQGIQLSINGKPWPPSANPVLTKATSRYAPPTGEAHTFYYLDAKGNVLQRAGPNGRAKVILPASAKGPHLSTIAVSPDGKYLAGLINGVIYTGPVGGRLVSRDSGGFTSVSWDPSDNLWAVGNGGVYVVAAASGNAPVLVNVPNFSTITALRVAPDGVRVALVVGGTAIQFAAISRGTGGSTMVPEIAPGAISPFSVPGSGISDVTWYGPDNVIALSGSGPEAQVTEYPVNGGTPTTVLHQTGMTNITASWSSPLIASTSNGQLLYTESIGGGWVPLTFSGNSAVYPG